MYWQLFIVLFATFIFIHHDMTETEQGKQLQRPKRPTD